MNNINKIKKHHLFKQITQKDNDYINFLKNRVGSHINSNIAQEMINFALSKQQSLQVLEKINISSFFNKTPVQNPEIHLVISQTGAGKSNISKLIMQKNANIVFIDTDAYKRFNPLKNLILEYCPTYFGHLTGLDSYLHRDYIYEKALNEKYNILIEITPSTKDGLFNIDFEKLQNKGYRIIAHMLVVSKINSLLSIHERYEKQIEQSYEIPKLTDLNRAIDSYNALDIILKELNSNHNIEMCLYKRDINKQGVILVTNNKENNLNVFQKLKEEDFKHTAKNINKRIINIKNKMQLRNAPAEQMQQLDKIIEIINNNSVKNIT